MKIGKKKKVELYLAFKHCNFQTFIIFFFFFLILKHKAPEQAHFSSLTLSAPGMQHGFWVIKCDWGVGSCYLTETGSGHSDVSQVSRVLAPVTATGLPRAAPVPSSHPYFTGYLLLELHLRLLFCSSVLPGA